MLKETIESTMNDIYKHQLLRENMSTVDAVSYDNANCVSLVSGAEKMVDFDAVKQRMLSEMGFPEEGTKSVDGIMNIGRKILLIEFKNTTMDSSTKTEVRIKAIDSLLILSEVLSDYWYNIRKDAEFVLVYEKNKNKDKVNKEDNKRIIQDHLMKKAKDEMVYFDMGKLKGYHFSNVHTYNQQQFRDIILNRIIDVD